jgi:L-lactate dehydrogenase complex protein LldE
MKDGLMVPCCVDMFYPEVGIATVELLEKLKVNFEYPYDQTCCGEPTANSGCYEEAKATEELFIRLSVVFRVDNPIDFAPKNVTMV